MDKDEENEAECKLRSTQRGDLLEEVSVIFWDEFPSNHRELFEAVVTYYSASRKRFIFVCSGDLHQIPPVIQGGTDYDTINASIRIMTQLLINIMISLERIQG
jgi:hypothetical protein